MENIVSLNPETSNTILEDTEQRLIKLSNNAIRQVEQLTAKAIDGNLKNFRLELRRSIQSMASQINNQNLSAVQRSVTGELGGGLLGEVASSLVGGAFQGGFSMPSLFSQAPAALNLSRGQRAVSMHQMNKRAIRDV